MTYVFDILAIGLLAYAALHDLAARTVPNWLPLCVLALGCLARFADHTLEAGMIIAGCTFAVLFAAWVLGVMGGGDVKLWAATALLIPPHVQPEINFFTRVFLIGGLLGLVYLALWPLLRRAAAARAARSAGAAAPGVPRRLSLPGRVLRVEAWRIGRRGPLPYALAIAAGGIFSLLPASFQL